MPPSRFDALARSLAASRSRRDLVRLTGIAVAALVAGRGDVAAHHRHHHCSSGQTHCGRACVDLTTDRDHCGQCDVACPIGATCQQGACVAGGGPCIFAGRATLCVICHVCRDGQCEPAPDGTPCGSGQFCLAGACGPVHDPAPCPTTGPSGITGQVLIGPMCPVEHLGQPCPDQPFAAALRIEDATGRLYCTAHSDDDGTFRAALPPGDYIVAPVDPNPGGPPHGTAEPATVEPEQYVAITLHFDSGIR
jgi:hypothetical protein